MTTDIRNVEEQNKLLLFAIEQSSSSIIITDEKGDIVYVNPKFSELTGYSSDEVIGKNPRILKSGKLSHDYFKKLWETITAGSEWHGEFHNKKKNKELYWGRTSISPVRNSSDNITHFIGIEEDITKEKQALEILNKMADNLIQQNKHLEQFSYIISHNLRAPVANIIGLINLLKGDNLNKDDLPELFDGLYSSANKLDTIIKDLNNILQIKKEINEIKEIVFFAQLVDDIKESISNLIKKENVTIKTDFAETDNFFTLKSYIRSIFYNLISNSIKYRRADIPPIIEIKSKKRRDKMVLIFKDNGLGIDLTKKGEQVFGLYKRFHDHVEGKGMGLFMTKMQVETLNGKIEIKSEVNKGTEFKIIFDQ